MSIAVIAFAAFLTVAAALGALILGVKDLLPASKASDPPRDGAAGVPLRLRRLSPRSAKTASAGLTGSFDRWFYQLVTETGLSMTPTAATLLLVLIGAFCGAALFVWNEEPTLAVAGMLIGIVAGLAFLMVKRSQRIKLLQDQLPVALDMLAHSVRAGQSLDQAVQFAGNHSPEPLAAEFSICAKQLKMGLSVAAVMRCLVDRVRLFDIRIFTTTLTVHRQTGGDVAKVLERLAAVIRSRLNYRRQLRAMTGAGRLSAMLMGVIGPFLFVYMFVFHPQYMETMMTSSLGQSLLIAAVVLELIGLAWMARLMKPQL